MLLPLLAIYILNTLVNRESHVNISLASQYLNHSHSWGGGNTVISG